MFNSIDEVSDDSDYYTAVLSGEVVSVALLRDDGADGEFHGIVLCYADGRSVMVMSPDGRLDIEEANIPIC